MSDNFTNNGSTKKSDKPANYTKPGADSKSKPAVESNTDADQIAIGKTRKTIKQRMLEKTAVLPAMFTLLNGISGFGAIYFTTKAGFAGNLDANSGILQNLQIAAGLMFVAMFCDMLDGRVARMTRTTSDFGAQLDSLCDMISFGVAPAMLALRASIGILRESSVGAYLPVERVIWAVAAIYVACSALRLARFNVETEQDESAHMDFEGLPSPAAASCIATLVLLLTHLMQLKLEGNWEWLSPGALSMTMSILLPITLLATALLMVSRCRYPHVVNHYIRGKKPLSYLIKLVVIVLLAVIEPFVTFALIALIFTLSGPIRSILHKKSKK